MHRLFLALFLILPGTMVCMQPDVAIKTLNFAFKPLVQADFALLFKWFQQPYIAKLWKEPQEWDFFKDKFTARLGSIDTFSFIAYLNDRPIGYIQYHLVNDDDRTLFPDISLPLNSVGIDLFIGEPECLNRGYGTKLLADFIEHIKKLEPNCMKIIIDPAPDNHRAIACYQKVGFKTKGTYMTPYGPTGSGPGEILLMVYQMPKILYK